MFTIDKLILHTGGVLAGDWFTPKAKPIQSEKGTNRFVIPNGWALEAFQTSIQEIFPNSSVIAVV